MKRLLPFFLCLAFLGLTSCREQADTLLSYGQSDDLVYNDAKKSFSAKFDIFWEGMNCNYALWDYEAEYGLDWDRVYDRFMPRFRELDARKDSVTDDEFRELLEELVSPLHDGHLAIQMQNHHTGNYIMVAPASLRNKNRADYTIAQDCVPTISGYVSRREVLDYDACNTRLGAYYFSVDTMQVHDRIAQLEAVSQPTDMEKFLLSELTSFMEEYRVVPNSKTPIEDYNRLCVRYEAYQIPGLKLYDANANENGVRVVYAVFPGNIVYFYLDGFQLSPWIDEGFFATIFPKPSDCVLEFKESVQRVWKKWFLAVQQLHKKGALGGVIIDVRGNGGGYMNDFQYVMGALLSKENYRVGDCRFKNGVGRLDYGSMLPQVIPTLNVDREEITEPVVVLANCRSVSMAEQTTLTAKLMPNGRVIGMKTWGGLCYLHPDPKSYTITYSSVIGEKDVTPVFCYIPVTAFFARDMGILEGIGITPDIEVPLDVDQYHQGVDTQLDRALQYLRTGN